MWPLALLAGGQATRLRPLTAAVPKSLLPVDGRPFIAHQLELLRSQGIERVVLCIGHLGEQIRALVGDGRAWGLSVEYSFDGERSLGTAGALRHALPRLGSRFFVLYGDAYLRCEPAQIQAAFERSGQPALLTVLRNDDRWDRSNCRFRDGAVIDYDKSVDRSGMTHIDFGLSMLSCSVLEPLADGAAADLGDTYRRLCDQRRLAGLQVGQRFYEIGSPAGLRDTEAFLAQRRCAW